MTTKAKLPLNSLEKFMLSHESETIAYNSQLVVEFDGIINPVSFKEILHKAVLEIPWLRTKVKKSFLGWKRYVDQIETIDLTKKLVINDHPLTEEELDSFCSQKFDLENGHNFQFMIAPLANGRQQLIFNVHHTLCDAAGQFLLLEEIFRLMNSQELRPEAVKIQTFRYRHLWHIMGAKWFLGKLWENRKSLKKQRQYKMASLIDHPESLDRKVSSITFDLNEEQKETLRELSKVTKSSITEYIAFNAFSAYDLTLRERGDFKTPIMAYVPKTIRSYLRIRYSFQNILSTVLIVGKRDEIHHPKLLSKIKHVIQTHKMDQAAKFIFNTLLPCALTPAKKLQALFQDMDRDLENETCSMLISAGKVPRSYNFPESWKDIRIWARGTMLKSPGVGIIYTGSSTCETITIEYIKGLTDTQTIHALKRNLLAVLSTERKEVNDEQLKIKLIPQTQMAPSPSEHLFE